MWWARFSKKSVRVMMYVLCLMTVISACALLAKSASVRLSWGEIKLLFNYKWRWAADVGLSLALAIILTIIFGFVGLCLSSSFILMIFNLLLGFLTALSLGFTVWIMWDVYSFDSFSMRQLDSHMNGLTPIQLEILQPRFHCCGIEKYTDYIMIWQLKKYEDDLFPSVRHKEASPARPGAEIDEEEGFAFEEGEKGNDRRRKKREMYDMSAPPERLNIISRGRVPPLKVWARAGGQPEPDPGKPTTAKVTIDFGNQLHVNVSEELKRQLMRVPTKPPLNEHDWLYEMMRERGVYFNYLFEDKNLDSSTVNNNLYELYVSLFGDTTADPRILMSILTNMYKNAVHFLVEYVNEWKRNYIYEPGKEPEVEKLTTWWWSSGWDRIFYMSMVPYFREEPNSYILPFSCCRNSAGPCYGHPSDTWVEGCKYAMFYFLKKSQVEIAHYLLGCFLVLTATTQAAFLYTGIVEDRFIF